MSCTPNDLADALEADADWHHTWAQFIAAHDDGSTTDADAFALHDAMSKRARAAAVLLRRQGEQLDTLRASDTGRSPPGAASCTPGATTRPCSCSAPSAARPEGIPPST